MATRSGATTEMTRTNVQRAALVVGAMFVLSGLMGFVPGITTNVGDLRFAGHESGAKLLGLFQVSILHNLVHFAFGVPGIVMARQWSTARTYLIGGGALYLLILVYGLVIDMGSDANFIPLNDADNWLHLFLGSGMIAIGIALTRGRNNP